MLNYGIEHDLHKIKLYIHVPNVYGFILCELSSVLCVYMYMNRHLYIL